MFFTRGGTRRKLSRQPPTAVTKLFKPRNNFSYITAQKIHNFRKLFQYKSIDIGAPEIVSYMYAKRKGVGGGVRLLSNFQYNLPSVKAKLDHTVVLEKKIKMKFTTFFEYSMKHWEEGSLSDVETSFIYNAVTSVPVLNNLSSSRSRPTRSEAVLCSKLVDRRC